MTKDEIAAAIQWCLNEIAEVADLAWVPDAAGDWKATVMGVQPAVDVIAWLLEELKTVLKKVEV